MVSLCMKKPLALWICSSTAVSSVSEPLLIGGVTGRRRCVEVSGLSENNPPMPLFLQKSAALFYAFIVALFLRTRRRM